MATITHWGAGWTAAPSLTRPTRQADLDPGNLRIQGKEVSARLAQAITDMQIESRIDGSGTLSITVYDYSHAFLRSQLLTGRVWVNFDGIEWTLVKLSKGGQNLTLTFEESAVSYLRQYDEPRKADRDSMTRAQFARSLITEVREMQIPHRIPEVNERQVVGQPSSG